MNDYERTLVSKYLNKSMSQLRQMSDEELNEAIADIINEREGLRDNSVRGIELDDLYNIVDNVKNKKRKTI